MAIKNLNKSRLKETSFSTYNLRDAYITDMPDYYSILRDEAIFSNYGIKVLIKIPADENLNLFDNDVDEYSNFVTSNWIDTVELVVPKFTEYRENVSENGMSADGTDGIYPLEVLIPSRLHLPRDSRIIFSEYDSKENVIVREWTVLSTQMKQLSGSKTYTRVAQCVPSRKEVNNNANTDPCTIWFDYNQSEFEKYTDIRAQGDIWFINSVINGHLLKRVMRDDIYEQVYSESEYTERVKEPMFYDSRPYTILDSGSGFKKGDSFIVKDESDHTIFINMDKHGEEKQPLILTITKIDDNGGIKEYTFNLEKGYTSFGENGTLTGYVGDSVKAKINLISIELLNNDIQEILKPKGLSSPKYILPYKLESVFSSKSISASVLN